MTFRLINRENGLEVLKIHSITQVIYLSNEGPTNEGPIATYTFICKDGSRHTVTYDSIHSIKHLTEYSDEIKQEDAE